jgi:hypothetical protein
MGPLAMQHGGSRVVAPPDGEEAPHQAPQEEVPHSCEVKFVLFLVVFQGTRGITLGLRLAALSRLRLGFPSQCTR